MTNSERIARERWATLKHACNSKSEGWFKICHESFVEAFNMFLDDDGPDLLEERDNTADRLRREWREWRERRR